ncbi:Trm112 family protein [Bartonella sp. DGB1]|uniref:Trm112 family protein n=1 Tax=Bartonella sp. DGB1 TaxID=3239807 RepID=UPI00352674F6
MTNSFSINKKILPYLVCPLTNQDLIYDETNQELISSSANLAYPIKNGIPIMLPEQARILKK